jgi:putative membrane protein
VDLATAVTLASHDHWHDHAGAWWPIIPLFWIGFFVLLFWGLRRWGCGRGYRARSSGESVLEERYAKGEINEQEYRERLDVLKERKS